MTKPNFFLVGAPKCGTTSLYAALRAHPSIFMSDPKEPDHFDTDFPFADRLTDEEYARRYFSAVRDERAIGEASTHYLASAVAIPAILAFNPAARFIVMIRNPVDMAQSLFFEERSQLTEDAPTFTEAWRRMRAREDQNIDEPKTLAYGSLCKVGGQIDRLLGLVPDRSRVMVVPFRRFVRAPADVYADVLAFLGVEHDGRTTFPHLNPRRHARSQTLDLALRAAAGPGVTAWSARAKSRLGLAHWPAVGRLRDTLRRMNLAPDDPADTPPLDVSLAASIQAYFSDDVRRVRALTGIDLLA